MLAARVVGLFLSTGLAVTLGSGGTGGGTLQLVRTVPADMASEVPTDIVVTAEFDNQGVALAMGSCGVTALRLGTGISKESAIRAARIYAQGNGWPWEEPIFVEEGVFRIRIMTAADRLECARHGLSERRVDREWCARFNSSCHVRTGVRVRLS